MSFEISLGDKIVPCSENLKHCCELTTVRNNKLWQSAVHDRPKPAMAPAQKHTQLNNV